jgi:hypothetical protein
MKYDNNNYLNKTLLAIKINQMLDLISESNIKH